MKRKQNKKSGRSGKDIRDVKATGWDLEQAMWKVLFFCPVEMNKRITQFGHQPRSGQMS